MAKVSTRYRPFYDRYYFNAHDRSDEVLLVFGVYTDLGAVDAFATVHLGDTLRSARFSHAPQDRGLESSVGGFQIEVVERLRSLRLLCEHEDLTMNLTWEGLFKAILDAPAPAIRSTCVFTSPRPPGEPLLVEVDALPGA